MPGEMWVKPLEDDGTEVYEPAKFIYLGQDIDDFIQVTSEDENTITFDIYWRHGDVKVEKAEKTDDGFVCKKEDFGDEGLRLTLIPGRRENLSHSIFRFRTSASRSTTVRATRYTMNWRWLTTR